MVQVDIKTSANTINFPKNQSLTGDLVLTLHSELTQRTFTFNVTDEGNSKRFYKFTLDLSEVDNGEYDYNINNIETGLIRIGAIELSTPEVVSFSDEVEIIQYGDDRSSQFQLQSKEVEYIQNGEFLVTPDNGYYGLKQVGITVNVPEYSGGTYEQGFEDGYESGSTDGFNSGYTEGYDRGNTEGYDEGVNAQKAKLSAITINQNGEYTREDGFSAITVNVPSGSTINNQNKNVSITANTAMTVTFDDGYTGLGNVGIDVNVPQTGHTDEEMQEAYSSGITKGTNEQKARLVTTAVTSNGTYTREDGYSSISVNVPSGSTINNQNKNISITANTATTVTFDAGYTGLGNVGIDVNVPTGSTINNQMKHLTFTANTNTYISYDAGYTGLEGVNLIISVPSDFNEGYASGRTDGYASGLTVGYNSGLTVGYQSGYTVGWSEGYTSGYTDGSEITIEYYTLGVSISSTELSGLINKANATVTYGSSSQTQTYTGSDLSFNVIPGLNYTLSFGDVSGYTKPYTMTGISTWGGSSGVSVEYAYTGQTSGYTDEYLTFNIISGGNITWKTTNSSNTKTISYKINNGTWTDITSSTEGVSFSVNTGDKVMFKGDNATYGDAQNIYCYFSVSTAKFEVEGNIMSLINSTGFTTATTLESAWTFCSMFNFCTGLHSITNLVLPATTLASYCYFNMFNGCSLITTAPDLPATTLATSCYKYMYRSCTGLTTAPELPATTLENDCYSCMFRGCSSLTTVPSILPATTLKDSCYMEMFETCTGLTTAPELPATTLTSSCYNMMFYGCVNLNHIKCLATDISASNCTYWWVNGVASTGTFVKNPSMSSWTSGNNGIPNNWTVQNAQ